jgi:hypothetical protein
MSRVIIIQYHSSWSTTGLGRLWHSNSATVLRGSHSERGRRAGVEFEASWIERDIFKRQIKLCESWNCLFRESLFARIDFAPNR